MINLDSRHPTVPFRDLPLTEELAESQVRRGLREIYRGEPLAIPVDSLKDRGVFLGRHLWREDSEGRVFRPGARMKPPGTDWQGKLLSLANRYIHPQASAYYYRAVLGHDLHTGVSADLFARHFHRGWVNPFHPDQIDAPIDPEFKTLKDTHWVRHECRLPVCPASLMSWPQMLTMLQSSVGFIEDLGWLSGAKVTTAFVSEVVDELVSATGSEFADFDYHEVGTSSTAEANTQTALQTSTGIARATGTPTDADPVYQSVATITADTSETWQEHGIFNNSSGPAMMDRSLTGGQAVNSSDQIEYTYSITFSAES